MNVQEKDFPQRINVEPTNLCNMHCKLCPNPMMTRPRGRMAMDLFRRIAKECAHRRVGLWLQYMGEPFMHPHIMAMISEAKDAGIQKVGLSTNAFFLDDKRSHEILASGLDRLECSVDALNAAEFQEYRGSEHFQEVMHNIESFLEVKKHDRSSKPITSIQYMASSLSRDQRVKEIIEHWKGRLGPGDFIMSIQDYSFAGSVRKSCQKTGRSPCRWIFQASIILWDGSMVLCGSDYNGCAVMGNVNQQSIEEIWKGPGFQEVRELHRTHAWDRHPLCRGCDDWRLSDGSGYENIFTAD